MAKKQNNSSRYSQPTLFDHLREQQQIQNNGSLNIVRELKEALSEDLRHASDEFGRDISRAQVAARMTDLLGIEISLSMLNNWTAVSHAHEMPISYLPVFIRATGGQRRAAEVISRHSGLYLLPGPDALRAEIQRFDEEERRAKKEKRKRMFYLKEMEGQ